MSYQKDFTTSLKLSELNTFRFLELYRNEQCLYDVNCEDYRNRESRAAATKRIADTLSVEGFGPKEVTAKFKNLRNAYSQELKKMKESEDSGAGGEEMYIPKVYWFTAIDSFLRPQMYSRPTQNNLELNSRGIHCLQPTAPKRKGEEEASLSIVSTSFLPQVFSSEVIKKKPPQACGPASEGDECKALSMLWISKLKKLDQFQRVIAEDLITRVLAQAFFKELTRETQIFDGVN